MAAGSPGASSTLFAATTTGLPDRRSTAATASSASVMPTTASTTNSTASAAATDIWACAVTSSASARLGWALSPAAASHPPVSTRVNDRPRQVAS